MGLLVAVLAVLLVAAWSGAGGVAAAPSGDTLDRAGYVALLHATLADVQAAQAADGAARDAAVGRAVARLPAAVEVRDATGVLAVPDLGPLRAALLHTPPDLDDAVRRLTDLLLLLDPGSVPTLTATPAPTTPPATPGPSGTALPTPVADGTPAYVAAAGAGGPPVDADEAGKRLDTVLRDPRFQPAAEDNGIRQGLSRALAPLIQGLLQLPDVQRNALISGISGLLVAFMLAIAYRESAWSRRRYWATVGGAGGGTALAVFLLLSFGGALLGLLGPLVLPVGGALGVVVVLAVLGFLGINLRRNRAADARAVAGAFAAEVGWTAAQACAAAAAAAGSGDFRRAVRYRYLATLLTLDESGRMRFDPALTDGDYLRRAPLALRDPLRPLVAGFQRFWYGGYPAGAGDYHAYQALAAGAEGTPAEAAQ